MRAAWATDVHLEFVTGKSRGRFVEALAATGADCVLLGGDIDHAGRTADTVAAIAEELERPVYFVLGNHDFYGVSIARTRAAVERRCRDHPLLTWLGAAGVVRLTDSTALVGHDGWADGRLGDYEASQVDLNDYYLIEEFKGLDKAARLAMLHRLGAEAADHFRAVLPEALGYRHVVVLTHVPPFREACWHEGRPSDDMWLPHYSCAAAGEAIVDAMRGRGEDMLVLCGHTHGQGEAQILPNLRVLTGGARYGDPRVQQVLEIA
jgi:Icc protein